jgi:uncharacterized membrane protein YfcA
MTAVDAGHAAILVVAGLAAGWINTIAGAGGVIAIPALVLWGLPVTVANGTMRVSVVLQNVVGTIGYARARAVPRGGAIVRTSVPAVIGALGGAAVATQLPRDVVEILLVATFGLVVVAALYTPKQPAADRVPRVGAVAVFGLVVAGFYGGLVQTGVGLVLLSVLTALIGHDLVGANALKVIATLAFNVVALVIFAVAGDVDWVPGLLLAGGSMIGAHLGVRFAIREGHAAIRVVVIAVAIGAAVIVLVR